MTLEEIHKLKGAFPFKASILSTTGTTLIFTGKTKDGLYTCTDLNGGPSGGPRSGKISIWRAEEDPWYFDQDSKGKCVCATHHLMARGCTCGGV